MKKLHVKLAFWVQVELSVLANLVS